MNRCWLKLARFNSLAAASAGLELMRRLPGRDILRGIQEVFCPCFPKGYRSDGENGTPSCGPGIEPHPADYPYDPDDPTHNDPGCFIPGELYRLLPLAMAKLDEALDGYWTRVELPQLPYRAFREFLERNFLAPNFGRTAEVCLDGDRCCLKTLGAHYHVLTEDPGFTTGRTLTFTITPDTDLPDREWALAVFNLNGDHLEPIHNWRLGAGVETLTIDTSIYNDPIVIVAGLYLGFTYHADNLVSETRYYDRAITYA